MAEEPRIWGVDFGQSRRRTERASASEARIVISHVITDLYLARLPAYLAFLLIILCNVDWGRIGSCIYLDVLV